MVSLWTASRNNTVSVTVTGSVIGTWAFNRVGRAHAATKTTRTRANLAKRYDAGFGLCGRGDMACPNQCGCALQSERFDKFRRCFSSDLTRGGRNSPKRLQSTQYLAARTQRAPSPSHALREGERHGYGDGLTKRDVNTRGKIG